MVPNLSSERRASELPSIFSDFTTATFYASGIALVALCAAIAWISPTFDYGTNVNDHPIVLFITLYSTAGLISLATYFAVPHLTNAQNTLLFVIVIGALCRLLFLSSTPIYEDDFYRYLWDGAVLAHGIDPFKYPPSDFLPEDAQLTAILGPSASQLTAEQQILQQLAKESGVVIERINYPFIKTEYPLVAQALFAASHIIFPWNVETWRIICLLCEGLSLLLIMRTLTELKQSPLWSIIYWWNPVAIVEIANRVHMEALLVPALLAVVYFIVKHKPLSASAALAGAVGIKFWPALLFPLLLRMSRDMKASAYRAGFVFSIACLVLLGPQLPNGLEVDSGLVTYSQSWQTNSFAFSTIENVFSALSLPDADLGARIVVFLVVCGVAVGIAFRPINDAVDFVFRLLVVSASLFLLSPTQYPWYLLWLLPFLVFAPVWPLLAISVSIPLYFSRYYFAEHQQTDFFNSVIVPLQFFPIFVLLALWTWRSQKESR